MMSQESITKLFVDLVRKHNIVLEGLTEAQLVGAIKQAIACGDFVRLVDANRQAVVYIPFREHERLKGRIKQLENLLREREIDEEELCQK